MYKILTLLSLALAVLFLSAAFLTYPGSTYYHPETAGYSLWENTISETGMTINYRHEPLQASRLFFTLGLAAIASTIGLFFFRLSSSGLQRFLAVLTGALFLAIPLFPSDIASSAHNYLFFGAAIGTWLCILAAVRQGKQSILWVVSAIALTLYLGLLITYPSTTISPAIHLVHVISQKAVLLLITSLIAVELLQQKTRA